jgi:hypothetical protein
LRDGGAVTFASAAALTLGVRTVPVYEIYKAGSAPHWLDGLDLLGAATGLRAAVIPHYDNAEGGHHDTRYCYLGERRLAGMEAELPADAFVLGVDEHTALVLDLDRGTAEVLGLGGVTVRVTGRSTVVAGGTTLALTELAALGRGRPAAAAPAAAPGEVPAPGPATAAATRGPRPRRSPLLAEADRQDAAFAAALAAGDVAAAVTAILELDDALLAWTADTYESDEPDRVRATLRSMIVRLGELASRGARDPHDVAAPWVEALLEARSAARANHQWDLADRLRDALAAAGVEVRDTAGGQEWHLTGT